MSNTKQYFQNLEVIPTVQELDDEAAATCSGGASITLYEHVNFAGDAKTFRDSEDNIDDDIFGSGWNNKTSSIVVREGVWRIFTGDNYTGSYATLYPGNYASPSEFGLPNDTLTAIQRVS
jgi:hypothetical protein